MGTVGRSWLCRPGAGNVGVTRGDVITPRSSLWWLKYMVGLTVLSQASRKPATCRPEWASHLGRAGEAGPGSPGKSPSWWHGTLQGPSSTPHSRQKVLRGPLPHGAKCH